MIQPGDFGLTFISQGMAGKLVQIGQWLNGNGFLTYDHAFVYIGHGNIVEADPSGIKIAPASRYANNVYWSTGIINPTDSQRSLIVSSAIGYVGTPYSFIDYFAIAAHRLHLFVPGLKAYIASTKHMICSQLVDQSYDDAGFHLFNDGRWPGYVTPGDLYELLQSEK